MLISISFLLFLAMRFLGAQDVPKPPNIYHWLEQNSYLCDPSLTNKRNARFLTSLESRKIKCSCGDPLKSKAACARRSTRDKPHCLRLPDTCMKEYVVIFANIGNRMGKTAPAVNHNNHKNKLNHHKILVEKHRKPHKKIIFTRPISAKLRIHLE